MISKTRIAFVVGALVAVTQAIVVKQASRSAAYGANPFAGQPSNVKTITYEDSKSFSNRVTPIEDDSAVSRSITL